MTLAAFLAALDRVPWFANLGKPHPDDHRVIRIHDPEEWVGPERLGGAALGEEGNRWKAAVMRQPRPGRRILEPLFERIDARITERAGPRVGYDLEDDAWVWSYAAVRSAAHLGAVIGCSLEAAWPLPPNALRQWAWYARGHWPCSYHQEDVVVERHAIVESSLENARLVVL